MTLPPALSNLWRVSGLHPPHGQALWVRVRAGAVQVATLAQPAEGETAHHMGVSTAFASPQLAPLPTAKLCYLLHHFWHLSDHLCYLWHHFWHLSDHLCYLWHSFWHLSDCLCCLWCSFWCMSDHCCYQQHSFWHLSDIFATYHIAFDICLTIFATCDIAFDICLTWPYLLPVA